MPKFIITYDLNHPGQDYPKVQDAIKQIPSPKSDAMLDTGIKKIYESRSTFHRPGKGLTTVWIGHTDWDLTKVCQHLKSAMDSNDELFVAECGRHLVLE